jgi:hypothetical protein
MILPSKIKLVVTGGYEEHRNGVDVKLKHAIERNPTLMLPRWRLYDFDGAHVFLVFLRSLGILQIIP